MSKPEAGEGTRTAFTLFDAVCLVCEHMAYFVCLPIWILNLMPSPILLFSSSADQVFEQGLTPAMTLRACCLPGVSHLNWVRRSWKLWMYGPQQRRPWKILFTLRNCQKMEVIACYVHQNAGVPAALHLLPLPLIKYYHCHRLLSSSTAQNPPPDSRRLSSSSSWSIYVLKDDGKRYSDAYRKAISAFKEKAQGKHDSLWKKMSKPMIIDRIT